MHHVFEPAGNAPSFVRTRTWCGVHYQRQLHVARRAHVQLKQPLLRVVRAGLAAQVEARLHGHHLGRQRQLFHSRHPGGHLLVVGALDVVWQRANARVQHAREGMT